tara:strand:- start:1153 stop:1683 length:531 start_codon:yes stop_codon:yes gene_type:complete
MNHEDKVLKDLLAGRTPEKRIMVGFGSEKKKQGDIKSELTDIMAEVRMPWFCPACDKVMKKRLDNKFWRLFGHCFDCQIEVEHELRVAGEFEKWERKKVCDNKRSIILEQIQSIKEWRKQGKTQFVEPVNVDSGFVHIETFERDEKVAKLADEALVELNAALESIEQTIAELNSEE